MSEDIPTLKAFPDPRNERGVRAWCPFCAEWHTHSIGPEEVGRVHRAAHCSGDSPFRETGYYLEIMRPKDLRRMGLQVTNDGTEDDK